MSKKIKRLIVSILICQGAGLLGSLFTAPAISSGWYAELEKPNFTPPSWVFGPAWTFLFLLMGLSLYLIWNKEGDGFKKKKGFVVFGIQLVFNILWSALFFGLRSPFLGLVDIVLLWWAIMATISVFAKISLKAAYLLVPYLLWVSFALALNFSLWQLNPSL